MKEGHPVRLIHCEHVKPHGVTDKGGRPPHVREVGDKGTHHLKSKVKDVQFQTTRFPVWWFQGPGTDISSFVE